MYLKNSPHSVSIIPCVLNVLDVIIIYQNDFWDPQDMKIITVIHTSVLQFGII